MLLVATLVIAWVLFAGWCAAVSRGPRRGEEIESGLALWAARVYARLMHRLRVAGREHLPSAAEAGPMLVVANHTAGIDPILVQAACGFEVSWMMAADMMMPQAGAVWRWTRVIRVERASGEGERKGDAASLREAVRRLQGGGVVGVFPEGRIERPYGALQPFMPGVGMLVVMGAKKCGGVGITVLPVVIEGTPRASTAWGSLWRRSRSTLRVLPIVRYERTATADEITRDLERRFVVARHSMPCPRLGEPSYPI